MPSTDTVPVPKGGASLILSWSLQNKHVLVVGGCLLASHRAFYALDADAKVSVVAPLAKLHPSLLTRITRNEISHIDREFNASDVDGKSLVFCVDTSKSKQVVVICKQRKIPVNLYKSPELSDFSFVSTHRENGFQIAVTTNGNAPKLADKLRRQVSSKLDLNVGRAVQRVSVLRQRLNGDAEKRLSFINKVTQRWSVEKLAALSESEISELVKCFNHDLDLPTFEVRTGAIKLVGAGPGDVKLLTMAAHSAIVDADLVISDSDVSDDILDLVSGELHILEAHESVTDVALPALELGKDVVRLCNGDPYINGNGKEEYKIFFGAGASVEVIPGLASGTPKILKGKVLPRVPSYRQVLKPKKSLVQIKKSEKHKLEVPKSVSSVFELEKFARAYTTTTKVASANGVVAELAYALSDITFTFPVFPHETASSEISELAKSNKLNVYGNTTKVVTMATRIGSGSAIYGALSAGTVVNVLAGSAALPSLIPTLHQISRQKLPCVIHVSSTNGTFDNLKVGYSQVMSASGTGATVISSGSAQEVWDLGVISHAVAKISGPVIHFYDGAYIAREVGHVKVGTVNGLEHIHGHGDALQVFEDVAQQLEHVFGRKYRAYEYTGPKDAKVVVVGMGVGVKVVEDVSAGHVGVLNVRVYRPWSAAKFVRQIPEGVEKIVVLDDGTGMLFKDVSAAVNVGYRVPPKVEKLEGGKSIEGYSKLLEKLVGKKEEGGVVIWETRESKVVEKLGGGRVFIGHQVGLKNVRVSQIKHSDAGLVVGAADFVGVHDVSLMSEFNVIDGIKEGGSLLVNASWKSSEDVEKDVPGSVRKEIALKNIKLYAIDAEFYARNYTLYLGNKDEYLDNVLAASILHLRADSKGVEKLKAAVADSHKSIVHTKKLAIDRGVSEVREIKVCQYWATASEVFAKLPTYVSNSVVADKVKVEEDEVEGMNAEVKQKYSAYLPLVFKEAYGIDKKLRPDVVGGFNVTLTENTRVTPDTYDRNVFHMEMDITGTGLKYEIGEALGVHGQNDPVAVERFLKEVGYDKDAIVYIDRTENGQKKVEVRSVEQVFVQLLDVFGKPGKKFYSAIAEMATDPTERAHLFNLISNEGADDLKKLADEYTVTYADLLSRFKSVKISVQDLLTRGLIPLIKPRHYSIASAQSMHPDSVHLLVVLVDWKTPAGEYRTGQCTRYLSTLKVGQTLTVSVKPSVMKLPPSHSQPVIMAGLGTGMAPFRAFIEERAYQRSMGVEVGPMVLYFGSRHRAMEYLYGEELEAYAEDGLLTHLRLAFSRDEPGKKVYIQHKIGEDKMMVADMLLKQQGAFYLCGPTWPVPDVRQALLEAFEEQEGWSREHSAEVLDELKEEERYILEVY